MEEHARFYTFCRETSRMFSDYHMVDHGYHTKVGSSRLLVRTLSRLSDRPNCGEYRELAYTTFHNMATVRKQLGRLEKTYYSPHLQVKREHFQVLQLRTRSKRSRI